MQSSEGEPKSRIVSDSPFLPNGGVPHCGNGRSRDGHFANGSNQAYWCEWGQAPIAMQD
jgi:hypothetical protein